MDDGRDRHARHVRGLVAASEVLAHPGLTAAGRLGRLGLITHHALDAHRTTTHVAEDGGGFRTQHRMGPALAPHMEHAEDALLADVTMLARLVRREVVLLAGSDRPPGRGDVAIAPMTLAGDLLGCICVEGAPDSDQRVDELTTDTLVGLANMGAHVLLAERLRSDRAEVLSRDLLTEQRNRRRIANRLHDGPQQILVSLRMRLQLLVRDASEEVGADLRRLADYVEAARDDLRALILDLDTMTGHTVLTNALRSLLETNGSVASWKTSFEAGDGVDDVSEETQLTVERVVQEALANARQHAEATHVSVRARRDEGSVTVIVSDDGIGIPSDVPTSSTGNSGIRAMHERIWLIGGALHIDSGPDRGTRVVVTAPRHP